MLNTQTQNSVTTNAQTTPAGQLDLNTTMAISKTVAKKRQPIGEITLPMPSVELIVQALQSEGIVRKELDEDGIPVYSTDTANWLMKAIKTAVQAVARNKLVNGSIELKAGQSLHTTLAELVAPVTAGGTGEHLVQLSELKKAFREFADSLGKTEKTTNMLIALFENPKAYALQAADMKAKIEPIFLSFMEAVEAQATATQLAYFEKFTAEEDEEEELFGDL